MITGPVCIYNNWSSYDELSDNVEQTEELAMRQLSEILRLRRHGVRIDYYMMDAFWFAPGGGYREWRKPHWPDGPGRWFDACRENGIKPGLWFSTNNFCKFNPIPEWEDSLTRDRQSLCLFSGGYLPHLMETLQMWYGRGVRAYKFDFANFAAATPELEEVLLREDIIDLNIAIFRAALKVFRRRHPDVLITGYNGFGGEQDGTWRPFAKNVDARWLEVFDSLYCGDPRPSDVPCMNFWRSKDIYTDHMVRAYEYNNLPLNRIDNTGFMIGTTGTCYVRRTAAWKGMLLLTLARGGWVNVYHGDLGLLDDAEADWFARAQSIFLPLQTSGQMATFGGIPGKSEPYGFTAASDRGAIYTVVNPSQSMKFIELPPASRYHAELKDGRLLFRDAGYVPEIGGSRLTLGPEQLAVVGFGDYANDSYDLGVQEDVVIPQDIRPIPAEFAARSEKSIEAEAAVPEGGDLRIVLRQREPDGKVKRTSGGSPPNGKTLGRLLKITVEQEGRKLPVETNYDKAIWSGLSWAVGEVKEKNLIPGKPVRVRLKTEEQAAVKLDGEVYWVRY